MKMETYLETLDLWMVMKKDYEIYLPPNIFTIGQINSLKEKKTIKSKEKETPFSMVSTTILTRNMSLTSPKEI